MNISVLAEGNGDSIGQGNLLNHHVVHVFL